MISSPLHSGACNCSQNSKTVRLGNLACKCERISSAGSPLWLSISVIRISAKSCILAKNFHPPRWSVGFRKWHRRRSAVSGSSSDNLLCLFVGPFPVFSCWNCCNWPTVTGTSFLGSPVPTWVTKGKERKQPYMISFFIYFGEILLA